MVDNQANTATVERDIFRRIYTNQNKKIEANK
jgi:hypothetical protein